jgi:hypothetical protein
MTTNRLIILFTVKRIFHRAENSDHNRENFKYSTGLNNLDNHLSKDESKVIWLTCPDCGSKIGIILSVGKATAITQHGDEVEEGEETWPPSNFAEKLKGAGVDTSLLNIEDDQEVTLVSPKKFLGDLWGPINETMRSLGATWIREGRESRWEIRKLHPQ